MNKYIVRKYLLESKSQTLHLNEHRIQEPKKFKYKNVLHEIGERVLKCRSRGLNLSKELVHTRNYLS